MTLTRLEFLPREQVEAILHDLSLQGQVAPGGIVCILTFTGTFSLATVRGPMARVNGQWVQPRFKDAHHTHVVIDASTGLTLIWGLDDQLEDAP